MTRRFEILTWLLLICLVSIGTVWVRTATIKSTYLFAQQDRELHKVQQKAQRARVTWLKLTSPARLDGLARNLKLFPARPDQVLRYDSH